MNILLAVLSFGGLIDSTYLTLLHFGPATCGSSTGSWACNPVLTSIYAEFFGIPLSAFGMGMYLLLFIFAIRSFKQLHQKNSLGWMFLLALVGTVFSIYLTLLQAFIIKHWCPFCLTSATIMTGMFIVLQWKGIQWKEAVMVFKSKHWKKEIGWMMGLFILPTLGYTSIDKITNITGKTSSPSTVVAKINDKNFTLGDVDSAIKTKLNEFDWNRYQARLNWIETQILETEAQKALLTVDQLVRQNIDDKIIISDTELKQFYEAQKANMPEKSTYDTMKSQIEQYLKNQRRDSFLQSYLLELKQKHKVMITLPFPSEIPLVVDAKTKPVQGADKSQLTIIEFSDFLCSYCKQGHQQMKDLVTRYPGKIRWAFRHFPLKIHPAARTAAYAAACADKQGQFWPMADILFANSEKLTTQNISVYARELSLNMEQFQQCIDSGQGKKVVEDDIAAGEKLNITSTPTFFFNGQFVSGIPRAKQLDILLKQYLK